MASPLLHIDKLDRGNLRKLEIVKAAASVIATKGLHSVTFKAVGEACGIGKSHVAYHFPHLEELIEATTQYVYAIGQATVVEYISLVETPEEMLYAYVDGSFDWLEKQPHHAAVTISSLHLGAVIPHYQEKLTQFRKNGVLRIKELFKLIDDLSNTKKTPAEISEAAEAAHSILMGNLVYRYSTNTRNSLKREKQRTYRGMLRCLLD